MKPTERERMVLSALREGKSQRAVARELGLKPQEISRVKIRAMNRLGGEGGPCTIHAGYRAIRPPYVICRPCWALYLTKNPEVRGFLADFLGNKEKIDVDSHDEAL